MAQVNIAYLALIFIAEPISTTMKFPPTIVRTSVASPLGDLTLAASATGLAGLWFSDQPHLPEMRGWTEQADHPLFLQTAKELDEYFAGQRLTFTVPLDLGYGTAFQQQVWQCLLQIAPGQTTTYGGISQQIGNPKAMRAVGGAVGRNPIGIIVPCHRVIGSDGSLTGYTGGLDRKIALLTLEPDSSQPAGKSARSAPYPITQSLF